MAYSTIDDIKSRISQGLLVQVSQEDPVKETANTANITQAIVDADALIDVYLSQKYICPLSPVPAIIKQVSVQLAIYNIYCIKYDNELPKGIVARYNNALKLLTQIQGGDLKLSDVNLKSGFDLAILTNITDDDLLYDTTEKLNIIY